MDHETGESGALQSTDPALDQTTLDALMRASRVVTAVVARSMARTDGRVTMSQLRVLVMVASGREVTTTAIADELEIHLSSASRLCDRLVEAGWLARRKSPTDQRSSLLTLTQRGRTVLSSIMAERRLAFARIVADLSPTQQRSLARSLKTFSDAAAEPVTSSLLG